jgi:hypothetical protein
VEYNQGERERRSDDADSDDLFPEDVTQALVGFAGILGLLVVTIVIASAVIAAALLRHL